MLSARVLPSTAATTDDDDNENCIDDLSDFEGDNTWFTLASLVALLLALILFLLLGGLLESGVVEVVLTKIDKHSHRELVIHIDM